MTATQIRDAREALERAHAVVEQNRAAIERARAQEARLDRSLATSEIKSDEYRRVLKRARLLRD